jgi:hypothetical protein
MCRDIGCVSCLEMERAGRVRRGLKAVIVFDLGLERSPYSEVLEMCGRLAAVQLLLRMCAV